MSVFDEASCLADWITERQQLAAAATGGPWKPIAGGVVAPSDAINPSHSDPANLAYYGGQLIGESMGSHNTAWVADARSALPAAVAALGAVLRLHRPDPDSDMDCHVCMQCGLDDDAGFQVWPCLTVQAISQEIGWHF